MKGATQHVGCVALDYPALTDCLARLKTEQPDRNRTVKPGKAAAAGGAPVGAGLTARFRSGKGYPSDQGGMGPVRPSFHKDIMLPH
jgi:hypothetical protein